MTIGVLLLATHKYKQFVQPLLNDIKKYFFPNHKIEVYLFTDDISLPCEGDERVSIIKELIVSYRFPIITLYRYKIFTSRSYTSVSYLFYLDVDMSIVDTVSDEILGDIVATLHPGFSMVGGGAWCTNYKSTAYTFPEFRTQYFAGGFQGGEVDHYYQLMQSMKRDIDEDERNNTLPEWHDEGILNKKLSELKHFKILHSGYCMVEQPELREEWKLNDLKVKIIALAKNHEEIRS